MKPFKLMSFAKMVVCCMLILFFAATAQADFADVSDLVDVSTANARSRLDRRTRLVTSTVDIILSNVSDQALPSPLHAVILFSGADPANVQMPGASGGADDPLYGTYYFELGGTGTFAPGQFLTFNAVFIRSAAVRFTYDVKPYAEQAAANQPPVAHAGGDQEHTLPNGQTGMAITLDGTASLDPDGTITAYRWSGEPDPADVMAPSLFLGEGVHEFSLIVEDNQGLESEMDTVRVTIQAAPNQAPVANAGDDRTLTLQPGQGTVTVSLDASYSYDPDGEIAAYAWTGTPDPPDEMQPEVVLGEGTHTFTLVVTDTQGLASVPASATITVAPFEIGSPPVITLNPDTYVTSEGENLAFTMNATDPDGDMVMLSAAPKIANATFSTTPGVSATGTFTFTPDHAQQGPHVISIKARDPLGNTATAYAFITVTDVNQPPELTVPGPQTIDEGSMLTVTVEAEDPDGIIPVLSASNLPENAVFIPATGTLAFTPDFEQAGVYTVTFTADDGTDSREGAMEITVTDVPDGGTGGGELTLAVNTPESPTLLTSTRITGTVNSEGAPDLPRMTAALITGLAPAAASQGETVDIVLTGETSGDFLTHFEDGRSTVDFGEDVTVTGFTVTGPTEATAQLTVSGDAALGPRSVRVTTGNETALSIVGFSIEAGLAPVSGVLVDPDTGQPLAGALVGIAGTSYTTTTGADGSFYFADIPVGAYTLIFNAGDHELATTPINTLPGQTADVGTINLQSTVFDPSAPPSLSLHSVIGRGAARMLPTLSKSELKSLITDTILLAGESELGVLDDYGNQLNPNAGGDALMSLTPEGVEQMADRMMRGETMALPQLLAGYSFAFQWGGDGQRMALSEWLALIQEVVSQAWADRNNPDNIVPLLVFNTGGSLLPDPPQISERTRLNPLQAFLFSSSLAACMQDVTP